MTETPKRNGIVHLLLSFALGVSISLAGAWGVAANKPTRQEVERGRDKSIAPLQQRIDHLSERGDAAAADLSEIKQKLSRIETQLEMLLKR